MPFKSVTFRTLGCRVNAFETAALIDRAKALGLEIVDWGGNADVAVVNSCALTVLAEAKTRREIRMFARNNPSSPIAVTGCMAQTDADSLKKLPNIAWIIGNADKMRTVDIVLSDDYRKNIDVKNFRGAVFIEPFSPDIENRTLVGDTGQLGDRMNLKIQDGCDNACSYCIIPRARGLPRSRDFKSVLSDARALVSRGVRELVITGINISKFSTERGGIVNLIDELNAIPSLMRLRLGSIEPMNFDFPAVFERMADKSHKLMPHLHISAQSLSDKVLSAMRRKYSVGEFLDILALAKSKVPDVSLGADIICGHPEEGQEEFDETKNRLPESGLSYAHIFTFSPRPLTLAATMKNVAPTETRKARSDELREIAADMHTKFMRSQIGRIKTVLLENRLSDGTYLAHTDNYIQTAVNIPTENLRNRLADVRIVSILGAGRVGAKFENLLG